MGENDTGQAGLYTAINNNLLWQTASGAGCINNWQVSTPVDNLVTSADYQWTYNMTGTLYTMASAKYASTPGTHDQSGNPAFADSTRNFLAWCTWVDPTVTTVAGCKTKLALMNLAGYNSAYNVTSLIDWVRAGFSPRNIALATAGSAGDQVGAMAPILMFGVINQ
jgi:hypothetical protein